MSEKWETKYPYTYPRILRRDRGGEPQQRFQRPAQRAAQRPQRAPHEPKHSAAPWPSAECSLLKCFK